MPIMRQPSVFRLRERGMSIVELLVGVAVGLIVVTGAIKLMVDTLGSNRRMLLETRVNQDLRAAADLIVRDVRRAGYWQNATSGVFSTTGSGTVTVNPYINVALASNVIEYQFARDADNTVQPAEQAGFRLTGGVLEFKNGAGSWQAMTDPKVVTITALTISPLGTPRVAELYTYCACMTKLTCGAADFQSGGTYYDPTDPTNPATPRRPTLTIRQFDVVLRGQSATDATVQREIRETVRVRNDRLDGSCPAV
jgi:type IV pilus assembly protein PilW